MNFLYKVGPLECSKKMENEDFSALLRTATPWTLQNKAFYSIVCHIYGPLVLFEATPP